MENNNTPETTTITTVAEEASNSSLTKEEQSFFAFDDVTVMATKDASDGEIQDIEPVLYLKSLESRVRSALNSTKGFHDRVSLAQSYDDDSKINIRFTTPVQSNEFETLMEEMPAKEVVKVETPLGEFTVPVPATKAIPKYLP